MTFLQAPIKGVENAIAVVFSAKLSIALLISQREKCSKGDLLCNSIPNRAVLDSWPTSSYSLHPAPNLSTSGNSSWFPYVHCALFKSCLHCSSQRNRERLTVFSSQQTRCSGFPGATDTCLSVWWPRIILMHRIFFCFPSFPNLNSSITLLRLPISPC